MPTGRSLHVGINQVSSAFPNAPRLDGPENDADKMRKLAHDLGFETDLVPPSKAKRETIMNKLLDAAEAAQPGDIFLFTFAGHGTSRVVEPDLDRDERKDQAILLNDRWLYDDELRLKIWPEFRKDVRVLMVADSCHSGTILERMIGPKMRAISEETRDEHLRRYGAFYRKLMVPVYAPVEASILLLAACEDFDKTPDGYPLGPFTAALLKVVYEQDPQNYTDLIVKIRKLVGPQIPQLTPFPPANKSFMAQKPFTI